MTRHLSISSLHSTSLSAGGNESDILHATPEKLKEIKKIDYVTRLISSKGDAYLQKYQSVQGHP